MTKGGMVMYTDSPQPGAGFLAVNIITIAALILIPVVFRRRLMERAGLMIVISIICAAGVVVFGAIIHSAFNTTYSIDGRTLKINNGFLLKGEYSIADIRYADKTGFSNQTFGSAFNLRGYCNRFTRGLRIGIKKKVIYISPSDRDEFIEELNKGPGI